MSGDPVRYRNVLGHHRQVTYIGRQAEGNATLGRAFGGRPISHNTWIHRIVRIGVRPLVRTAVTPNQITALRLAVGVAAAAAFATGGSAWLNLGALLFFIGILLDRADGELARLSGRSSAWGHYFDLLSDHLANALALAGIGFGLRDGDLGFWAILLGLAAGISVSAIFWLVTRAEKARGQRAAELPDFMGFDVDDATLIIPVAVVLDGAAPLIVIAGIAAPAFAIFMYRRLRASLADVRG